MTCEILQMKSQRPDYCFPRFASRRYVSGCHRRDCYPRSLLMGIRRWNQMRCSDLTQTGGTELIVPVMAARVTCLIITCQKSTWSLYYINSVFLGMFSIMMTRTSWNHPIFCRRYFVKTASFILGRSSRYIHWLARWWRQTGNRHGKKERQALTDTMI